MWLYDLTNADTYFENLMLCEIDAAHGYRRSYYNLGKIWEEETQQKG